MRALAEFIMRGRAQANMVALFGSLLPLISPATVALVSLRRGPIDGTLVLLWALLPAIAAFWLSDNDFGPLMTAATIFSLLVTYMVALLLRNSRSWPQSLMALVAMSCFAGLMLSQLLPELVHGAIQALVELMQQAQANAPSEQSEAVAIAAPSFTFMVGLVSHVVAIGSVLGLLLARWWQALLYNPGGFQLEFHQLRLAPMQALVCALAVGYCWMRGGDYQAWAGLFSLPLQLVGIAIVHYAVKARQMDTSWLVLFYLSLIMVAPLTAILTILAVIDTWTNFRARIRPKLQS